MNEVSKVLQSKEKFQLRRKHQANWPTIVLSFDFYLQIVHLWIEQEKRNESTVKGKSFWPEYFLVGIKIEIEKISKLSYLNLLHLKMWKKLAVPVSTTTSFACY